MFLHLKHTCVESDNIHCTIYNKHILLNEDNHHVNRCYTYNKDSTLLKLPKEREFVSFEKLKNQLERPYAVYADFECKLMKVRRRGCIKHAQT